MRTGYDKAILFYVIILPLVISGMTFFQRLALNDATMVEAVGEGTIVFFRFLFVFVVKASVAWYAVRYFNQKLPWKNRAATRLFAEFAIVMGLTVAMTAIASLSYLNFAIEKPMTLPEFISAVSMSSFVMGALTFAVVEQRLSALENFELKVSMAEMQEKLKDAQLESMRNQLNPHFLFNSLNSLSDLIYDDVEKADRFISEFARIYRYVLQMGNAELVRLSDELKFIESFVFLHKIRFKENLVYNQDISDACLNKQIPPFTLQILVENAIKHNEISRDHPLRIDIRDEGNNLLVMNSFRKRLDEEESTGIGQKNLGDRYRLLAQAKPRFEVQNGFYVASVPLIAAIA